MRSVRLQSVSTWSSVMKLSRLMTSSSCCSPHKALLIWDQWRLTCGGRSCCFVAAQLSKLTPQGPRGPGDVGMGGLHDSPLQPPYVGVPSQTRGLSRPCSLKCWALGSRVFLTHFSELAGVFPAAVPNKHWGDFCFRETILTHLLLKMCSLIY